MRIEVIQTECSVVNSVYIYHDFLEKEEELVFLTNKVKKYTETDNSLDYQTNVQAKMTDWKTLLQDQDFTFIHQKILMTLYNTINLRNPNANEKLALSFRDSWGMSHKEGDFTKNHIHSFDVWSGAFYLEVPHETKMWIEDYQTDILLKNNMLILFPGTTKHKVFPHIGDKNRYSMAFNISITSNQ